LPNADKVYVSEISKNKTKEPNVTDQDYRTMVAEIKARHHKNPVGLTVIQGGKKTDGAEVLRARIKNAIKQEKRRLIEKQTNIKKGA
jgi:hypothetical protein